MEVGEKEEREKGKREKGEGGNVRGKRLER